MNILFPFLAAVLQAGSFTLDKFILSIKRIGFREYASISFPLVFFFNLIIFLIFRPSFDPSLFSNSYFLILIASITMFVAGNLMFYRALDSDYLSEIEVFELLANIPVIIFTSLIFSDERNPTVILLALVASLAVVWSHWENHHLNISKNTKPYILWILLFAPVSAILTKKLLMVWDPILLELVRNFGLAIIIGPLFAKRMKNIPKKGWILLGVTNLFSVVAYILLYSSYKASGVVYSVLVFSLMPLLIYFSSIFFLKEPINWKKGVAFGVVLISIIITQIFG